MRQIIKLMDVPAEMIGKLYEVLKDPEFKKSYVELPHLESSSPPKPREEILARVIRAFSKDGQKYVIEIETVPMVRMKVNKEGHGDFSNVFPSIKIMQMIYDVLGIYPEKERVEPSN